MNTKSSTVKTSLEVAKAISLLHGELVKEYGSDFSYTILGRGETIGANNYKQGYVVPVSMTGMKHSPSNVKPKE